jgi:hypothetical protein
MTIIQKQELLEKLSMLRAVLSGDIDPKALGIDIAKTDGGNRRTIALAMVDAIGSEVHDSIAKDQQDRPPFGFAAGRKAA